MSVIKDGLSLFKPNAVLLPVRLVFLFVLVELEQCPYVNAEPEGSVRRGVYAIVITEKENWCN